jgi:hypothetical protein
VRKNENRLFDTKKCRWIKEIKEKRAQQRRKVKVKGSIRFVSGGCCISIAGRAVLVVC